MISKIKGSFFLLLLSGCSSVPPQPESNIEAGLMDAAMRASRALEQLALLEQARNPRIQMDKVSSAGMEQALLREIPLHWHGPLEEAVRHLAREAGYGFEAVGMPPAVPVIVHVDEDKKPLFGLLRELGLQAGGRADIHVSRQDKTVEVRYGPRP